MKEDFLWMKGLHKEYTENIGDIYTIEEYSRQQIAMTFCAATMVNCVVCISSYTILN